MQEGPKKYLGGKQNIRWGLAIYRDYLDGNRKFEIEPLNDDVRGVLGLLKEGKINYTSKNPKNTEAHYYGMTQAIKRAGFVNGESNILVLVGDAGNHFNDEKGLTKNSVIDLLAKKRINLISFQVNFETGKAGPAYAKFASDSKNYITGSAALFVNSISNYEGITTKLNKSNSANSYELGFKGFKKFTPLFGVYNHAIPGKSMSKKVFRNNLVNSFLKYMENLDSKAELIECKINRDCDNIEKIKKRKGEGPTGPELFDASSDEICKLLNLTPEQCQLFINEGDISISGYTHMKVDGHDFYNSVAYMSKKMKRELDERLGDLAYVSGSGQKARDKFYSSLIRLIQGLVGEKTSEELIKDWTFNKAWEILLNIPFSQNNKLNTKKIRDLQTSNISGDDFEIFLESFKSDVEVFIDFPKDRDLKYTVHRSGSQTFYWIPFSKIPRGEE